MLDNWAVDVDELSRMHSLLLSCLSHHVSNGSEEDKISRNPDESGFSLGPWTETAHLKKIFMATLLPPPKRQKVYNGIPEPEKVPVEQSPNVVVQFVSEDDGSALAPAVSLPANVSREDLQSLVNRLTSKVACC